MNGKARFIGIQKGIDEIPDTALFNIEQEGHARNGSTVCLDEVLKMGLEPIFQPLPPQKVLS